MKYSKAILIVIALVLCLQAGLCEEPGKTKGKKPGSLKMPLVKQEKKTAAVEPSDSDKTAEENISKEVQVLRDLHPQEWQTKLKGFKVYYSARSFVDGPILRTGWFGTEGELSFPIRGPVIISSNERDASIVREFLVPSNHRLILMALRGFPIKTSKLKQWEKYDLKLSESRVKTTLKGSTKDNGEILEFEITIRKGLISKLQQKITSKESGVNQRRLDFAWKKIRGKHYRIVKLREEIKSFPRDPANADHIITSIETSKWKDTEAGAVPFAIKITKQKMKSKISQKSNVVFSEFTTGEKYGKLVVEN